MFLRKDSTNCLVIRFQPSTRTKRINLKGVEIMTGGNMIIPMDISTEATTISMIMKGMNSRYAYLECYRQFIEYERWNEYIGRHICQGLGFGQTAHGHEKADIFRVRSHLGVHEKPQGLSAAS
jgi:hypothetical protein